MSTLDAIRNDVNKLDTLGKRLRKARKLAGFTQEEFVEKVDETLRPQRYSLYENDKSSPNEDRLKKMAEVLDVSVSWLAYGEPGGLQPGPAAKDDGSVDLQSKLVATEKKLYETERKLNALKDFLSTRYVYEKDWRTMAEEWLEEAEDLANSELQDLDLKGEDGEDLDIEVSLSGWEEHIHGLMFHRWVPKEVPEIISDIVPVQQEPFLYESWLRDRLPTVFDARTNSWVVRESSPEAREWIARGEALPPPRRVIEEEPVPSSPPMGEWSESLITEFVDYLRRTGYKDEKKVRDRWWARQQRESGGLLWTAAKTGVPTRENLTKEARKRAEQVAEEKEKSSPKGADR